MLILYIVLSLMLISALSLLAIPFFWHRTLHAKHFLMIAILFSISAFSIYQFSGNKPALRYWLAEGKTHYQLQETIEALGGIKGMITRMKTKLKANPSDSAGWFILGKLYLTQSDTKQAAAAFKKAHELQPDNQEITAYYQASME